MFKAIISAALVFSPIAFADEPATGSMEPAAPAKDAAPAEKGHRGGHHGGHKGHHGHKAEAPPEAPAK